MKLSILPYQILGIWVGLSAILSCHEVSAAEFLIFRQGSFNERVSVQELTSFAQTGQASPTIRSSLRRARQNPEEIRALLSREITVSVANLDRLLYSPLGALILDQLSQTFQTPVNAANQQALRGALLTSASRGDRVSVIEVLHHYPSRELYVDARTMNQNLTQMFELARHFQTFPENE